MRALGRMGEAALKGTFGGNLNWARKNIFNDHDLQSEANVIAKQALDAIWNCYTYSTLRIRSLSFIPSAKAT